MFRYRWAGRDRFAAQSACDRVTLYDFRSLQSQFVENGWQHIDGGYGLCDCAMRHWRGRFDDQGNMQRRVVDEEAVCLLAVFAQPFAMICEQNDHRSPIQCLAF